MESFSSDASSSSKELNASAAPFYPTVRKAPTVDTPHVLIVDDDPVMRRYLEKVLYACECLVTPVESALDALEFIYGCMKDKPKVSMICVKYNLSQPGLNGYQLLVQIKRSESPAKDIPVVIFCPDTNPAHRIELDKCMSAGALMVVRKYLGIAEVVNLLKQIMQ